MNNLEETDRKDVILRRKIEARNLKREKNAERNLLERYKKVQFSQKKCRYLEWTIGGDNDKKCTSTEGKTGQI